jgi:2,4-diketo-3-deoxy-L-fuconate hydrolase
MKLAVINDRAHLVVGTGGDGGDQGGRFDLAPPAGAVDIESASDGAFGPDMMGVLADWERFVAWAATAAPGHPVSFTPAELGPVVPRPAQVFAIGLNYRAHAIESGLPIPEVPLVFTKFRSSIAAPFGEVPVVTPQVDWEVEVTAVIGRTAHNVAVADGWSYVAGLTAAQDYSARDVQLASTPPQFSLGKSFPAFLPLGPLLVTVDEFDDPDDVGLQCLVNGRLRQSSSTADLVFSVPTLVAYLSSICTLFPGDLILTGTPAGVGLGMKPPMFLAPGDEVVTRVDLVGEMRQQAVEPVT